MLQIHIRNLDGIQVLNLKGRLLADPDHTLWQAVQTLVVDQGARQLLLNFEEVALCDSFGISELLRLHASLTNLGGRLVLFGMNDLISKVFQITHVEEVLHLAPDEATALMSLRPVVVGCE
jgi:anti-anti-sigma factor